jgi:endogenous inhibitor of DNA gyrase (YacG/DUF329 family)
MNDNQTQELKRLRMAGLGYKRIATQLDVSVDVVKYQCRKFGLTGQNPLQPIEPAIHIVESDLCRNCGKTIQQIKGKRTRVFCSNECRDIWWKSNRSNNLTKGKKVRCKNCGKSFLVGKNASRKYCSHECYIAFRFGGASDER